MATFKLNTRVEVTLGGIYRGVGIVINVLPEDKYLVRMDESDDTRVMIFWAADLNIAPPKQYLPSFMCGVIHG